MQQGTIVLAAHAFQQGLQIGVKPHRYAPFVDAIARARVEKRAAAGREHDRAAVQQAHDDAPLAVAKIALAIFGENLGNGHAGRRGDDLGVRVDEGKAEPHGQPLADGALAGAHHADQHDNPAIQGGPHGQSTLIIHRLRSW